MWTKVVVAVLAVIVVTHGADVPAECQGDHVACNLACDNGYVKDAQGCDTCQCLHELCVGVECGPGKQCRVAEMTDMTGPLQYCSDPRLPARCQLPSDPGTCKALKPTWYYNVETDTCSQFDYGGCQGNENRFETEDECLGFCKPVEEGSCSPAQCLMYCPNGFMRDTRGCDICQCREVPRRPICPDDGSPKPVCLMHCPLGFRRGVDGCEICECAEKGDRIPVHYAEGHSECLAVMCMISCPHGYKQDRNGCNLCECLEPKCPEPAVQCTMFCEWGFRKDAEGCDKCECRTQEECQGNQCRMKCPFGFLHDDNECNLCLCHDPCQEANCASEMSCLVVDSSLGGTQAGDYEPRCVPEHFKDRPWCSDAIECDMHCQDGFKADHLGCPKCQCLDGPAPVCELPRCEKLCPFGYMFDEDGCTTCKCIENPCEGHSCGDNEVCEAFKIKRCLHCPAEARCIEVVQVERLRISMALKHSPVEDIDVEEFAEQLIDDMSELMNVEDEYILGVRIEPLTAEMTTIHFHVISTGTVDLVQAYEEMKEELEEEGHIIDWEGQTFTVDAGKLMVSYSSVRELPPVHWDDKDDAGDMDTQTIIIICVVVAGAVIIIALVVAVLVRRRNKGTDKRNVAYSKTPQSENVRVKDSHHPDV